MSKAIAQFLVVTILVFAISVALIVGFSLLIGWLLPIATAGLFAPGFVQCVAIIVLGMLARALIFANAK